MTRGEPDRRAASSRVWLWGPVAVQMALIFSASSIPDIGPLPLNISDKSGHSVGYALLGALLLRALARGRLSGVTWARAVVTVLLATMYGVADEFHQSFVPGRTPDRFDVLADGIGSACSAIAIGAAAAAARACGILKRSS